VTIAAELGDRSSEAQARRRLGKIYCEQGELEAARGELEAARELAAGGGRQTREAEILVDLARVEDAAGRPEHARRRVAEALERLEDLRTRIDSPDLRTSYSSLLRDAYELEVDLLAAAHRADPAAGYDLQALEVAERARGRTLLELLIEADVDLLAGVDPALQERRRSLFRRLDAKTERLGDPQLDAPSRRLLEAEQVVLLQRLEVLDAEIRRQSPAYSAIVRPKPLGVREIQTLVDPGTTLAVYLLGASKSYLWRVTTDAIDLFELPARAVIETVARRVHSLWSELDVAARPLDHAAAEELAEMLRLEELAGLRRLAVIADGALHLVPFAALPVPAHDPGSQSPSDGPGQGVKQALITRADVVALPSASVLAFDRQRRNGAVARRSVAILADPAFGPDYPRLPGSRHEAEAITDVIAEVNGCADCPLAEGPGVGLTALGVDANLELVVSGRLRSYGILHFATHGVIDTENPALSGLVLSQIDARGRPRQGFLRLHDVYTLHLDAELVVLSGCRTALGPVVKGEGLIGLARGFMYAGAQRVVASLWQVEDQATAALMRDFYRALWQDGSSPATALARAQRALSRTRRFRDPYYWAAFVLVGDWR
jgi:CHAT domain-containing protein